MVARYGSIQGVRDACGVDSTIKSDAEITRMIEDVEARLESFYNTSFTPIVAIDVVDGTAKNNLTLKKNPVLQIRKVRANKDTTINPSGVDVSESSGCIYLNSTAGLYNFPYGVKNTIVEYVYAWLEETRSTSAPYQQVQTTLDGAITLSNAGGDANKVVSVVDGSLFSQNDFVRIWGVDGKREVALVISVNSNDLTLDFISTAHENGSYVTKLQTPEWFVELVNIVAGIKAVAGVIGSQFDEITGYTLGDLSVQKGEPYTQWRETIVRLVQQRDDIMSRRTPRARVA